MNVVDVSSIAIGPSSIHNALELELPSGTVLWGSGVSSTARGMFEAKVVDQGWGNLDFGVQLESSDIAVPALDVAVEEEAEELRLPLVPCERRAGQYTVQCSPLTSAPPQ